MSCGLSSTQLMSPLVCLCRRFAAALRSLSHPETPQALVRLKLWYFAPHTFSSPQTFATQTQMLIASVGMLAQFAFRLQFTHASHRACLFSLTGDLVRVIIRIWNRYPLPAVQRPGCKTFCLKSITGCLPCMCSTHTPRQWRVAMVESANLVLQAECAACNCHQHGKVLAPTAGDRGDLKEHWSDCRGQDTLVIVERAILRSSN